MNDGLIPQRYARALYKFALEKGNASQVYEEMKTVVGSFESNPELQKMLANPFVSKEDKAKLLIAAAGANAEEDYKSFVKIILNHRREEFAYAMALDYRRIYRDANKISQVKIVTAGELGEDELAKLDDVVKHAFPDRTLEIVRSVDPSLIGGFVITVDSTKMDASVSNEIEQLRHKLLRSK